LDVQVEKNQQSPVEYELKVSVSADIMAEKVQENFDRLTQNIKLPGFRPGHVPHRVLVERFGKAVSSETAQEVLQEAYRDAIEQSKLDPVSPARMGEWHYEQGEPLTFTVSIEVMPPFDLPPLSDVSVELLHPSIEEEDVLAALNELRESHANLVPTEEPVATDCVIHVDMQELDASGLALVGRVHKDLEFDLSRTGLGEEFVRQVVGLRNGQSAVIELPVQSHEKEPKTARYQIVIGSVKRKELPALDDAFAHDVNERMNSLDDLKEDLRRYLEARANHSARQRMFRSVADALLRMIEFPVPPRMVEHYLEHMVRDAIKHRKGPADPQAEERLREDYRAAAIWDLRWHLVKKKLIVERKLDVADSEYEEEVQRLAQADGGSLAEFKKRLTEEQQDHIREDLLERKVLSVLESEVQTIPRPVSLAEFEGRAPSRIITA
jgi:trigger factor